MSSHARFYVWFGDDRPFDVIEMDGVTYTKYQSRMFELAAGQRVSILVGAYNNCAATRTIAASDPKVGHGTKRCPMLYTDGSKAVQFAYGFLDVGTNSKPRNLPMTEADVVNIDRFRMYAKRDIDANFHFYPSGSWDRNDNEFLQNRIQLYYTTLFSDDRTDLDGLKNYDYVPNWDREVANPVAISDHHDFEMLPSVSIAPWVPPRPTGASPFIHYVRLQGQSNGLAAMAENPVSPQTKWEA